jgi:hypothetical protein
MVRAALSLGWRSLSETLKRAVFAATAMVNRYWALSYSHEIMSRAAKAAKELKSRTSEKLYVYETLLRWPPENFKHMSFAISGSTLN